MAKAEKDGGRAMRKRGADGRFVSNDKPEYRITIGRNGGSAGKPVTRKVRDDEWTEAKRETFLGALAETVNIARALKSVKMSVSGLRKLRKREPDFDMCCDAALEEGYGRLELAMLERSRFGVQTPIFYGGKKIGDKVTYPDAMGLRLLRLHRETAASVRARRVDPAVADADRDAVFVALRARIELAKARRKGGPDGVA